MSNKQSDHNIQRARTIVSGPNTQFSIDACQSQICADITVSEFSTVRVWGQIKNTCNEPVPGVLLKLVRVGCDAYGEPKYYGLAHTISDCDGFYQFDVCANSIDTCYKVIANKSATGCTRVLSAEDPCEVLQDKCICQEENCPTRDYGYRRSTEKKFYEDQRYFK